MNTCNIKTKMQTGHQQHSKITKTASSTYQAKHCKRKKRSESLTWYKDEEKGRSRRQQSAKTPTKKKEHEQAVLKKGQRKQVKN